MPLELLLDTHTLIWWASEKRKLSRKIQRLLDDDATKVVVSAASAWEIATKVRLGKLRWEVPESVESYCISQGFELLPVTFAHGELAGSWPQAHGDPFDRMLAAQADREGMLIATNDSAIKGFGVKTIW